MTPDIQMAKTRFDALYRAHGQDVHRFAFYLMRHREEAEDLYQEVWLRAAKHIQKLHEVSEPKRWLFTLTANAHRDWLRRQRLHRLFFGAPDVRSETEGEWGMQSPDDVPARLDLARAVAALPPRQRQIFILKTVEGYKLREIAEMLHIQTGTAKSMLHAAVCKLREALPDLGTAPGEEEVHELP